MLKANPEKVQEKKLLTLEEDLKQANATILMLREELAKKKRVATEPELEARIKICGLIAAVLIVLITNIF